MWVIKLVLLLSAVNVYLIKSIFATLFNRYYMNKAAKTYTICFCKLAFHSKREGLAS